MSENNFTGFTTGDGLLSVIEAQTSDSANKFQRRDFVEPLIKFCLDGNYTSRLGIVYGLRSTGKTVGMLQAAGELIKAGYKAAYARFNYKQTGMRDANSEIIRLAEEGHTHFFVDEAQYLGDFLSMSAEWADVFVPQYRIKIVISGTDSFELWLAMNQALYHRYIRFSTNRGTFPEYKRVWGKGFDEYKSSGGVFLANEASVMSDSTAVSQVRDDSDSVIEHFIENAVVDNLMHTLEHCAEYTGRTNYYVDRLYAIDKQVIFKGVISILKSTVEEFIRANFIKEANQKNIPNLGEAVKGWSDAEKDNIKKRIAESMGIYQNSIKISDPAGAIDALISFLVKTGCLIESATGVSDLTNQQKTLYFAHNALMNYALQETVKGILSLSDIKQEDFVNSILQAAEGGLIENIVYTHLMLSANGNEKVFRYRDAETREIDAVIMNREAKTARLIEIKSKSKIDINRVFTKEAKHLFDREVLSNIGIYDSYEITRVIAYRGESGLAARASDVLLLVNIEDLLEHYKELGDFLDRMAARANKEFIKK